MKDIAQVSKWTGIPMAKMLEGEIVRSYGGTLASRVVGETRTGCCSECDSPSRLASGARSTRRLVYLSRAHRCREDRAGKGGGTLFGNESDSAAGHVGVYEKHSVPPIGAPPGYVGYERRIPHRGSQAATLLRHSV
jgi:ATP-dependent Clp protease ATP-binding subunit ClpB